MNRKRRRAIIVNHSATHILHAVLREILGDHITQKGSLVAQDKLRFDISHPKAVSSDEFGPQLKKKVNAIIRQNSKVQTRIMLPEDAIKAGAMALFGEKYGDEVRVVNMGRNAECDYSVELCGGIHVERAGDIGVFKIISESAIAAGIRRIEALTGQAALDYIGETDKQLAKVAERLKVSIWEVADRIEVLLGERKKLERDLAKARKDAVISGAGGATQTEEVNGVPFIGKNFGDVAPKEFANTLPVICKKQIGSGVVVVTSSYDGKGSLIIAVSDDLTNKVNAVDLVNASAEILGAKGGGGKANFAQTGGTNGDKVEDAIAAVKEIDNAIKLCSAV